MNQLSLKGFDALEYTDEIAANDGESRQNPTEIEESRQNLNVEKRPDGRRSVIGKRPKDPKTLCREKAW